MKVGLFIPCYINAVYPEVGIASYKLLRHVGVDVDFLAKLHHNAYPFYGITSPGSRQCCGLRQRCA